MKSWLTQFKREYWEYNTSFLTLPMVIAVLALIAGIYVVVVYGTPDSKLARSVFDVGYTSQNDPDHGRDDKNATTGENKSGSTVTANDGNNSGGYIVDFNKGKLTPVEGSDWDSTYGDRQHDIAATLYGIQQLFLAITAFVLLFYLLSCLYADRKDRSIMFWKSMPVSENRNVAVKYITAALVVPVVFTLISWLFQLCYLLLATVFVYRIGSDPWQAVWENVDVLGVFYQQLLFVLWDGAWLLPLTGWLLFASALAKRSPFLVATIPFVFVILMQRLLFDNWSIFLVLWHYLIAGSRQLDNLVGNATFAGTAPGHVDLLMNSTEMLMGFVITALLYPATVWLRNHRFEI